MMWQPITHEQLNERFLDLPTMQLIKDIQIGLVNRVRVILGRAVHLHDVDLSNGIRTMPFASLVNNIERNIQLLVGSDSVLGMQATHTWRGGLLDMRRLSYLDVNRWFKTLEIFSIHLDSLMPKEFETDDWQTGEHIEFQIMGVK